jgi:hypothetical protein
MLGIVRVTSAWCIRNNTKDIKTQAVPFCIAVRTNSERGM